MNQKPLKYLMGIEKEFSLRFLTPLNKQYFAECIVDEFPGKSPFIPFFQKKGGFLPWGLYYLEMTEYIETATAESRSFYEMLICDRLLSDHLLSATDEINTRCNHAKSPSTTIAIVHSSTDYGNIYSANSRTSGLHRNFWSANHTPDDKLLILLPFFVTMPIIGGSGCFTEKGSGFAFSPRAFFINCLTSETCHGGFHPIVDIRKENLARGLPKYGRRFHMSNGDCNRSDTSFLLSFIPHYLLLMAIEKEFLSLDELKLLSEPIDTLQLINQDINLRQKYKVSLNNKHEKLTAVEIQYFYLRIAEKFYFSCKKELDKDPLFNKAINLWRYVLESLKTGQREKLKGTLDYAIKHFYYSHLLKAEGINGFTEFNKLLQISILLNQAGKRLEALKEKKESDVNSAVLKFLKGLSSSIDVPIYDLLDALEGEQIKRIECLLYETPFSIKDLKKIKYLVNKFLCLDLSYHTYSNNKKESIWNIWKDAGFVNDSIILKDSDVQYYRNNLQAPQGTRATLRSELIKKYNYNDKTKIKEDKNHHHVSGWNFVRINSTRFELIDPFQQELVSISLEEDSI